MTTSNKDAGASTTANGTDGIADITTAMESSTIQELGRKVFVGNLSFTSTEAQLREIFGPHGEVSEVQIIHRGTRSLGYGFVTFSTCEDAEKAVATMDKTELDGRTINAEIAKPAPGTPGGPAPRASKGPKGSGASSARQTNGDAKTSDEDKENQASPTSSKARHSKRPGGRGRMRRSGRPRRPAGESKPEANGEDLGATTDTSAHPEGDSPRKPRSQRARSRRGRGAPRAPGAPRGERRPRRTGPPEGEPSKTLVFVANLPFNATDEGLKEFFSGYQVASAHVVRRKFGPVTGRSKGFGFVEFENEENQLKALEETQGKEFEGRPLHVKVAINETKKEDDEGVGKDNVDSAPTAVEPAAA